jgi:hypothetical protein
MGEDKPHSWLDCCASSGLVANLATYPIAAGCTYAALDTILEAKNTGWRRAVSYSTTALVASVEAESCSLCVAAVSVFPLFSWKASGTIFLDDLQVFRVGVLSTTRALDSQRSREAMTLDPLNDIGRLEGESKRLTAARCPSSPAGNTVVVEVLTPLHADALLLSTSLFRSELASDDAFVIVDATDSPSELGEDLPDEEAGERDGLSARTDDTEIQ